MARKRYGQAWNDILEQPASASYIEIANMLQQINEEILLDIYKNDKNTKDSFSKWKQKIEGKGAKNKNCLELSFS